MIIKELFNHICPLTGCFSKVNIKRKILKSVKLGRYTLWKYNNLSIPAGPYLQGPQLLGCVPVPISGLL